MSLQFLEVFLACLAAFAAVYVLGDVLNRFDDIMHYDRLGHFGVIEYLLLRLPLIVSQLLPAACLAGVLLGFAVLNRNGEILAFQQLGFSRAELAAPVVLVAVLISLGDFAFSESVVPLTARQARYVYTVEIKKKQLRAMLANRNIWMRVRNGFLSADSYDPGRRALQGITIFHLGSDHRLHDIFHLQRAVWDGRSWQLYESTELKVQSDGAVSTARAEDLTIDATPKDFSMLREDPEEFSLPELNIFISRLRDKGLDPGGYLVDRDLKYALPFACSIMVALGVALSLDPRPRTSNLGRSLGLGIALGAGYWVIMGISSSFGRSGLLQPWVAAWLPNGLFALLAFANFLRGEQH